MTKARAAAKRALDTFAELGDDVNEAEGDLVGLVRLCGRFRVVLRFRV